jgi:hypothetical protein
LGSLTSPSNIALELFKVLFVVNGVEAFCEQPLKTSSEIAKKYLRSDFISCLSELLIT